MRKKRMYWQLKKGGIFLSACLLVACGKENVTETDGKLTPTEAVKPTSAVQPTDEAELPTAAPMATPAAQPDITEAVPLSESEIIRQAEEKSGQPVAWISCQDYNQDGLLEGFVLTGEAGADYWEEEEPKEDGTYDSYYGEVWFVSEAGVTQLLDENYYMCPEVLEIEGEQLQKFEVLYASESRSHLFQVTADGAQDILPGRMMSVTVLEDGRIEGWQSTYDICSDGTGHSFKPYYFYYEDGLKEYGGIAVEEAVFRQYVGADSILDSICAAGGEVREILYFSYGSFYINYQTPSELGTDVWINSYLEARLDDEQPFTVNAVSLYPKEEAVAWDGMLELDMYYSEGIYLPALLPEIAVYPERCEVPEEFYIAQYEGMEKSALVLRLYGGETVLTGEDIEAISERNLIFTLTDEFLAAAAERIENKTDTLAVYGVQKLLGITKNESVLELWLGDELLVKTAARDYLGYDLAGFMTHVMPAESMKENSYKNRLVLMNYELPESVEIKLHAFAKVTGLLKESEPVELTGAGNYATDREYLVDLNGDGELDSLYYGQKEFVINGKNYFGMLRSLFYDNPDTDDFFLIDLDESDGIMEIAIWAHGPSNDECSKVFWYDGVTLHEVGDLPGPGSVTGEEWVLDGKGQITLPYRLSLLQTWWADKTFQLEPVQHVLELVGQDLYNITGTMAEQEYTLLRSIRLYEEMDINSTYTVLEPQMIKLPATDDNCFVLVNAENGTSGYMYLEDGMVQLADGSCEDWMNPAIEGLNYAD